ncbi:MAG: beta-lactamase family protein [Burkholderiales bacterium]|jgi:CubicO group peptidase (beta-lactamase class C family)|nr:beta-lactamase family protein [Burkholderiales bacterium]
MSAAPLLQSRDPAELGLNAARLGALTQAFEREIASGLLPGMVGLISRRGEVGYFECRGQLSPLSQVPMARDSLFRIYSMTKPIVSVACLMLAEQGLLLLHEPVSTWLPEFAQMQVGIEVGGRLEYEPARSPITIQDLLRHSAGLTYGFLGSSQVQQMYTEERMGAPDIANARFCEQLARLPLMAQPGTAWAYSHATDVLGRVIEVIAGQPLGEFLNERIFTPLGMVDTGFHVPLSEQHRIAEPFALDPQTGVPIELLDVRQRHAFESGGGGLVSTASDFARFLLGLRGEGGTRILGRHSLALMTADHLGKMPILGDVLAAGHGFGLGFAVRREAGLAPLPGSMGLYYWGGIAGTSFFVDPVEQLFAVLMIQAPVQRHRYRALFRHLVYAALDD